MLKKLKVWLTNNPFRVLVFLTLLSFFYYYQTQPQITQCDGYGPDGTYYHRMYQYYKGDNNVGEILWPFNKRPGLPWLASKMPLSETLSFLTINLTCGVFSIFFCYCALRKILSRVALFACLAPMLFYFYSPIRYSFFYPFTVDPPAIAFYSLAAFLITEGWYWRALVVLTLSCAFREQGVYFALFIGPTLWATNLKGPKTALAMTFFALFGALLNHWVQFSNPAYAPFLHNNQAQVVQAFLMLRLGTLEGLPSALTAISHTLAPFSFALPALFPWRNNKLNPHNTLYFLWFLIAIGMAMVGGSSVVRIFFMAFPFYVVFLANLIKDSDPKRVAFFALGGLIANSFTSPITVIVHEWWVPSFFDFLAGRTIPLTFSFGFFWAFIYSVDYFFLCKKIYGRKNNLLPLRS